MIHELDGRVVAVSPHLDDVVFSLGASLWAASRGGADISVVTVFAGDPSSQGPAGPWDARAGFATAGAAARRRRDEDARACAFVGVEPSWLPFGDLQYGDTDPDEAWLALEPKLAGADIVLVPGFPLDHGDHRYVTKLVLDRLEGRPRVGLYAEQPYAMISRREVRVPESRTSSAIGSVDWQRLSPGPRAWLAKQRALRAYRTQLLAIARPLARVPALIALHERQVGGETIGWLQRSA